MPRACHLQIDVQPGSPLVGLASAPAHAEFAYCRLIRSLTARKVAPNPFSARESTRALVTTRAAALHAISAPSSIKARMSAKIGRAHV
jgi:hypothetical protein